MPEPGPFIHVILNLFQDPSGLSVRCRRWVNGGTVTLSFMTMLRGDRWALKQVQGDDEMLLGI